MPIYYRPCGYQSLTPGEKRRVQACRSGVKAPTLQQRSRAALPRDRPSPTPGTQMNALAEMHTLLVADPPQVVSANSSKCCNWFEAAEQQSGRGEPSLIAGIICEIVGEHHVVATDQVYVAGMSAGGAINSIMGVPYPHDYAATGIHSGLAPNAAHDLSSAFAAMRQRGGRHTLGCPHRGVSPDHAGARVPRGS